MRYPLLLAALAAAGCITPISSRIDAGDEAFVIVVGEGKDGSTDLFAAPAEGGTFYQLTFTRVVEMLPRIAPSGTAAAFARRMDSLATEIVVLHLLRGTEQRGALGNDAGSVEALGWSPDGDTLAARTDRGVWWTATNTARLVWHPAARSDAARLDSLTYEWVGDGGFGMIRPCLAGGDAPQPCVVTARGDSTALGADIAWPIRWGSEALGYFRGGRFEIRPLAGGRPRQPTWVATPSNPRQPTHHPGAASR